MFDDETQARLNCRRRSIWLAPRDLFKCMYMRVWGINMIKVSYQDYCIKSCEFLICSFYTFSTADFSETQERRMRLLQVSSSERYHLTTQRAHLIKKYVFQKCFEQLESWWNKMLIDIIIIHSLGEVISVILLMGVIFCRSCRLR